MAAHKTARKAGSPSPAHKSRLLSHWSVLCPPLMPFLSAGDVFLLAGTCPALQNDPEMARRALEAMDQLPKCFFLGCSTDWCADVPLFYNGEYQGSHQSNGVWQYPEVHEKRHTEEVMEAILARVGSIERRASLLSLAWHMATELRPLLESNVSPRALRYRIIPFILPLARLEQVARECPPPGPPTALGCHSENMAEEAGEDARCALCAALHSAEQAAEEYQERRGLEEQELEERLLEEDCDDFNERMDAYYASRAATDELYGVHGANDPGTIVKSWCADGTLPPLQLLDEVDDSEFETATCIHFYESKYYVAYGFCRSELRPLATFFHRHGFGRVHRTTLQRHQFESEQGSYKDEICRVEMVGAEAPHGFFAGVYYVAWYT